MALYAQIIINFATVNEIDRPFTYEVGPDIIESIKVGHRVKVPFGMGNKLKIGYVIGLTTEHENSGYTIKKVNILVEATPILDEKQMELAIFIANYYVTSYAAAIDVVLPPGLKESPIATGKAQEKYIGVTEDKNKINEYCKSKANYQSFNKQKWIIDYLLQHNNVLYDEFVKMEQVSKSSIKTLEKNGIVNSEERQIVYKPDPIKYDSFKVLNEEQEVACDYIRNLNENRVYKTVLLEGVTGSGKTEVFLNSIKSVLERGDSALVLVPEIALTSQTLSRFKERFGNRVALTHSRMTPKERQIIYMKAKRGELSVVIGPRSAVFMPLENLSLIVIDEAHETTYKSENTPKYNAIEVANKRMSSEGGQVLLATATPTLESYKASRDGEYGMLTLKNRAGGASVPDVEVVDMRLELQTGNTSVISIALHNAIEEALTSGGQVMLLLNRRGYSTFISCRSCGYVVKCEHCDVSMTYHANQNYLQCHYCGNKREVPEVCPECGSKHIRFMGSGTQKAEAYLNKFFERYGVARMDMDTTSGKYGHQKILDDFRTRRVNVLIGTQMIAKGHDFPGVTLVGVLSADSSLFIEDFRSSERTYQLLTQARGRAGRGLEIGKVIIQTYNPEHMVIEMMKDNKQEEFYKYELANRRILGYPPYGHIFSILVVGENENEVIKTAGVLSRYYTFYSEKGQDKFRVIGPSSAVIGKIGDSYRWRLIIIGENRDSLVIYGRFCLEKFYNKEVSNNVKIQWDIDPLNMF